MSKWLKVLLITSITCIFITRYLWANTPEFWAYGEVTGELLTDLSIGFIAAFIFYMVDIWYPNLKKRKRINGLITLPLSRLLYNMKRPIEFTVNKYSSETKNISSISPTLLKKSIRKINVMKEKGPVTINLKRDAIFLEYLFLQVENVNQYCKQLYEFPLEMDVNLISLIDRIRNSAFHQDVEFLNTYMKPHAYVNEDYFSASFPEYLELYKELHKFMKDNKIEFTITNL